jgi:hypothetical protein
MSTLTDSLANPQVISAAITGVIGLIAVLAKRDTAQVRKDSTDNTELLHHVADQVNDIADHGASRLDAQDARIRELERTLRGRVGHPAPTEED